NCQKTVFFSKPLNFIVFFEGDSGDTIADHSPGPAGGTIYPLKSAFFLGSWLFFIHVRLSTSRPAGAELPMARPPALAPFIPW
ncbi:hypothetical protein, partial [Peteryoungia ipomoeae]|uniref:hypothetical protein n=1 Tax=Peteryoungia ipomoeae TaxID=1210932 RepID=UPI00197D335A